MQFRSKWRSDWDGMHATATCLQGGAASGGRARQQQPQGELAALRTLTTIDAAPLKLPYSSVTTTPTVHSAAAPAGTAATLIGAPGYVPTGRVSCEPVTPGSSVMVAPLVQPPADQSWWQPSLPQSVPAAGVAVISTLASGGTAALVAALASAGAAGAGGLLTYGWQQHRAGARGAGMSAGLSGWGCDGRRMHRGRRMHQAMQPVRPRPAGKAGCALPCSGGVKARRAQQTGDMSPRASSNPRAKGTATARPLPRCRTVTLTTEDVADLPMTSLTVTLKPHDTAPPTMKNADAPVAPLVSVSAAVVAPAAAARLTPGQVPSVAHAYSEKPGGADKVTLAGAVTTVAGAAVTAGLLKGAGMTTCCGVRRCEVQCGGGTCWARPLGMQSAARSIRIAAHSAPL